MSKTVPTISAPEKGSREERERRREGRRKEGRREEGKEEIKENGTGRREGMKNKHWLVYVEKGRERS